MREKRSIDDCRVVIERMLEKRKVRKGRRVYQSNHRSPLRIPTRSFDNKNVHSEQRHWYPGSSRKHKPAQQVVGGFLV